MSVCQILKGPKMTLVFMTMVKNSVKRKKIEMIPELYHTVIRSSTKCINLYCNQDFYNMYSYCIRTSIKRTRTVIRTSL